MLKRYREFRQSGHGRLVSGMHAPQFKTLLIVAVIAGVLIGLFT